jgi:hypothetical protein
MIPSQLRLNEHLARWDQTIRDYRTVLLQALETDVDLAHRRAIVKTTARHENPKAPEWLVDALADEDAGAHELALEHARAAAELDHLKARLRWAQAAADGLRTEISTERAEAQLYAGDRSTP